MAATPSATKAHRRPRSRRSDGGRLREEIIDAAREILAETGGLGGQTLRGVARRVGIAATSIYLHFPDTEHLAVAATEQTFADLTAAAAAAAAGISDPAEAILARCRAYCHFALEHPAHYQVVFHMDQTPSMAANPDQTPGRRAFQVLVRAVQECQTAGVATATGDPFRLASLVWATEHGLVSLSSAGRRSLGRASTASSTTPSPESSGCAARYQSVCEPGLALLNPLDIPCSTSPHHGLAVAPPGSMA